MSETSLENNSKRAGRYDLILIKTLRVYEEKIISARQHVLLGALSEGAAFAM